MIIAGIGSRETPKHILVEMTKIGVWCREAGIAVRSGHAEGADWAFEQGAQEACIAYRPWDSFNQHLKSSAHVGILVPTPLLERIAATFHPAWGCLSNGARLLMMRNVQQVLGPTGNGPEATAIVCWTPEAKGGGGTGQSIRIAQAHHILVYDMAKPGEDTAKFIIGQLTKVRNDLFASSQPDGLACLT